MLTKLLQLIEDMKTEYDADLCEHELDILCKVSDWLLSGVVLSGNEQQELYNWLYKNRGHYLP